MLQHIRVYPAKHCDLLNSSSPPHQTEQENGAEVELYITKYIYHIHTCSVGTLLSCRPMHIVLRGHAWRCRAIWARAKGLHEPARTQVCCRWSRVNLLMRPKPHEGNILIAGCLRGGNCFFGELHQQTRTSWCNAALFCWGLGLRWSTLRSPQRWACS